MRAQDGHLASARSERRPVDRASTDGTLGRQRTNVCRCRNLPSQLRCRDPERVGVMIAGRELRYRAGVRRSFSRPPRRGDRAAGTDGRSFSDSLPCRPRALGVRVAEGDSGRGRRQPSPEAGPMQETASSSQADGSAGLHDERRRAYSCPMQIATEVSDGPLGGAG
jgi:hypothetical protein